MSTPQTRRPAALALLALLGVVGAAGAGYAQQRLERVRVAVNAGAQVYPDAIAQRFTRTLNLETAEYGAELNTTLSPVADAGVRVRVWQRLAAGITVSYALPRTGGTVSASLPHPLYFRQPRAIDGRIANLDRRDLGVHAEAAWTFPITRTVQASAFGGPSYVQVRQVLVTDLSYTESFPFDTAAFAAAVTGSDTAGAFGFNVGADLTWRVGRRLGVAGLVRYSRADVTLAPSPGNRVDIRGGGVQAGGGLRFYF